MKKAQFDWLLIIPVCLQLVLGLTVLQSVAPDVVNQQGLLVIIGIVLFFIVSQINYLLFANLSWGMYISSIILLVITLLIGQATRGSVRWIPLGLFRLQTSEIAKPLLIIFFAKFLTDHPPQSFKKIITAAMLALIPISLVFRQPDLGSSLVLTSVWLGMMFVSGAPMRYFFLGFIISIILIPIGWQLLADYQKARVTTFINPLNDPLQSGYHLNQSIIAVGSGQFWGRGLGQGTQSQLRFLPERHTDFIFASLAEELGFFGCLLLIVTITFMLARIRAIANNAPDRYGEFLSIGIFSMIIFQTFINIAMNIGLVPITGITLPLISFGGSSLLSTLISLGLVVSVSRHVDKSSPFEIR